MNQESSDKSSDKILAEIRKNNNISAKKLGEILGLTPRAVEKQIAYLKSIDSIKRVGSRKLGHWEVLN